MQLTRTRPPVARRTGSAPLEGLTAIRPSREDRTRDLDIAVADRWADMQALRTEWIALSERDPEADYFLSFEWMEECFRSHPNAWSVVTARLEGRLVGVLPLSVRTRHSKSHGGPVRILRMGGRLQSAQYTGFLREPALDDAVAAGFSAFLARQRFDRLRLENVLSEAMLKSLLSAFDPSRFRIEELGRVASPEKTDNLVCPSVEIFAPFEAWIDGFSKNRRRKFNRSLRQIGPNGAFRVVSSCPDTALGHLEILLGLWAEQWRGVRSASTIELWRERYWHILGNPARRGELQVPVLYQGDRPICAVGNIVDRRGRHLYCIVTGRDIAFEGQDVGTMIHMHAIENAIVQGVRTYDFCHGNEAYKYHFGCTDRRLASAEIRPR